MEGVRDLAKLYLMNIPFSISARIHPSMYRLTVGSELEIDFVLGEGPIVFKWVKENHSNVSNAPAWMDEDWAATVSLCKPLYGYFWSKWAAKIHNQMEESVIDLK
jgi:hypothetical protein